MRKDTINWLVDIGLIITFILVAVTGIIKFPGLLSTFGIGYGNLPKAEVSMLHDWSGIAMAVLVIIHLALHWNWIVVTTKRYLGRK